MDHDNLNKFFPSEMWAHIEHSRCHEQLELQILFECTQQTQIGVAVHH